MRSKTLQAALSLMLVALLAAPPGLLAASHREAPITALDRLADITDYYAFVSYDDPSKVTFILDVDPLLEPSNGPTYFPFDPEILYAIKVDNNHDGVEDGLRGRRQRHRRAGQFTRAHRAGNSDCPAGHN